MKVGDLVIYTGKWYRLNEKGIITKIMSSGWVQVTWLSDGEERVVKPSLLRKLSKLDKAIL